MKIRVKVAYSCLTLSKKPALLFEILAIRAWFIPILFDIFAPPNGLFKMLTTSLCNNETCIICNHLINTCKSLFILSRYELAWVGQSQEGINAH